MLNKKKVVATIEARMTSTRLPGKVLLPFCGQPSLYRIIERLRRSECLDDIIVVTTVNHADDVIVDLCKKIDCHYFRGSEEDVLLRVLEAAKSQKAAILVEITGDCPCVDWRHVNFLVKDFFSGSCDYEANTIERSFPRGFDVQVFPVAVLNEVEETTKNLLDREHVSLYIYNHPEKFKLKNWKAEGKMFWPELAVTLDTKEDYDLISKIYQTLYPANPDFSAEDVVDLLKSKPELQRINKHIIRKNPLENYAK